MVKIPIQHGVGEKERELGEQMLRTKAVTSVAEKLPGVADGSPQVYPLCSSLFSPLPTPDTMMKYSNMLIKLRLLARA